MGSNSASARKLCDVCALHRKTHVAGAHAAENLRLRSVLPSYAYERIDLGIRDDRKLAGCSVNCIAAKAALFSSMTCC